MLDRPVQRDTRRERELASEERGASMSAAPVRRRRLPVVKMPRTRAECAGDGLCLKLSCEMNTVLDVNERGSIRLSANPEGGRRTRRTLHLHRGEAWTDRDTGNLTEAEIDAFDDAVIERLAELETSCALDLAERGGMSQVEIAEQLGYTRQRVDQLEKKALRKAKRRQELRRLAVGAEE